MHGDGPYCYLNNPGFEPCRIDSLLCGSVDAPLTAAGRYRIFQLAQAQACQLCAPGRHICSQERIFRADVKALG